MAVYVGFSTQRFNLPRNESITTGIDGGSGSLTQPIQIGKKFRLIDEQLIMQDFVNALNIPQGSKPGKPSYGTSIWSFIFEPNTPDTQFQLESEMRRVASQDPRLILNSVISYPQENGILLEVEIAVSPFNNAGQLQIFFDQQSNSATLV